MVTNHQIVGFSTLKARTRSGGRREQVGSCHAVFRGPPDAIPGPLGHPPQQPTCTPIVAAQRGGGSAALQKTGRCSLRGCALPPWTGWLHPGQRLRLDEADAAEADATEAAADAEADAELKAVFPAVRAGRFRVGVTGGGTAGRPCPNAAGLMAVATRGRWATRPPGG